MMREKAKKFVEELPYKKKPYSARNWGHKWHSLCSYHGKLKPSIASFLISEFTNEGDVVLDPLCGVGTIPFEAALQGRIGIGNDLSELAYCVSKSKLERPSMDAVDYEVQKLKEYITNNLCKLSYEDAPYKDFGLNRTLSEYFHEDTYREILLAREYFLKDFEKITAEKAIVLTALLHVLHGNRPYALSRTSHPLTPYAPRGEYIYKNVIEHVETKLEAAYKCDDFSKYIKGKAIWGDFKSLNNVNADAIITSPPFADSIRFYSQNWMRLWLCGWEPDDFKQAGDKFLDQKQNGNFDVYKEFFEMCFRNLKPKGMVILHLGKTKKFDMAKELYDRAEDNFDLIFSGDENVETIEKHGIKDKGATTNHQFLFLQKK